MSDYLLCVAGSDIDYFYHTEKFLGAGDACLCRKDAVRVGGCVLNVAVAAANKGLKTYALDYLSSSDEVSQLIVDTLQSLQVDTSAMHFAKEAVNGSCLIFQNQGERCIYVIDPVHPVYKEDVYPLIRDARCIYTLPRLLKLSFSDLELFADKTVYFDGSSQYKSPAEKAILYRYASGVFINTQSYACLKAVSDQEPLAILFANKCRFVVITDGERGCDLYTSDQHLHQEAFAVNVVDSTGAGDSFAGTFIACLKQGYDYSTCLKMAAAAGAMACQLAGGMCSTFDLPAIRDFISNN